MKRNKFSIKKDAWEKLEKNSVAIALNGLFANIYVLLMFQDITQTVKTNYFFSDSKWRRTTMKLCCNKKMISIIKKYNIKKQLKILYFELSSFL